MIRNKTLLAALLLSALLSIFFFDVLFLNKTYLSGDAQSARSVTFAAENDATFPQHFPYIFSGMPSIMVYTSPYLYFPNILTVWMDPYKSLHVRHTLHYLLAGIGMFLLLKSFGFWAGIVGAISFMFSANMVGQEIFGHGGLMMTAAYIPMIFWIFRKCFSFTAGDNYRNWGIFALLLGLQMQRAHYQIIYYTWELIGAYFIYSHFYNKRNGVFRNRWRWNLQKITILIGCIILALGMAAMTILPTMEYVGYSIRNSISFDYASSWSLHPKEMITFIHSNFYGFGDSTYTGHFLFTHFPNYLGIIVIILACFASFKLKLVRFFWGVIIVSLIISFGKYTPVYEFLYDYLPLFNRFRAPVMILMMVHFSLAVLAGIGFNRIQGYCQKTSQIKVAYLIVVLLLIDLWFVGYKMNKTKDVIDLRIVKNRIVEFFKKQKGLYRVLFVPPLRNTSNFYAVHKIETVFGYHPAKLKIYQENVIDKPQTLEGLSYLNVVFIVSKDKIDGLKLVESVDGVFIYSNHKANPRYFLEGPGRINLVDRGIEYAKMQVSTEIVQRLVFSEIYYPSWKVYVDGREKKNEIWRDLLCSVELEPGEHLVELKYEATYFQWGVFICFFSVGIIGFLIIRKEKMK